MAGKTTDPKRTRITVRIADTDMKALMGEARRRGLTVGAIVREVIRLSLVDQAPQRAVALKR